MKEKITYALFLIWPLFVIALAIFIGVIYRKDLEFSPSQLINDAVDFMLGIISMILSFWFANIYWKKKLEKEYTERYKTRYIGYLSNANIVINDALSLINQPVKNEEKALKRDEVVNSKCMDLGHINKNTIRFLNESTLELRQDKNAAKASAYYRQEIEPMLLEISILTKIRPGIDDLILKLKKAKDKINQNILSIGGISNESN